MGGKVLKIAALVLAVALVVCVPLFVDSTYATDENQVTSSGARFALYRKDMTAGTLTEVADGSQDPIFEYTKWEPGHAVIEYFSLDCEEAVDFTYSFQLKAPSGEITKLAKVIDVYYVATDVALTGSRETVLEQMEHLGTLDQVLDDDTLFTANGNDQAGFAVAMRMRSSADNAYQGLSLYSRDGQPQHFNVILTASVKP